MLAPKDSLGDLAEGPTFLGSALTAFRLVVALEVGLLAAFASFATDGA
jgi:hypothetical protein